MHCHDEGEAHPVAVRVPVCNHGWLLWPADGGNAVNEVLQVDAVQSLKPIAELLCPRTSRDHKSSSTGSQGHGAGRCIRRPGYAPLFEYDSWLN